MNRQEKIELLKSIAAGKATINDANRLEDAEIWLIDSDKAENLKTGESLTLEQYNLKPKKDTQIIHFK